MRCKKTLLLYLVYMFLLVSMSMFHEHSRVYFSPDCPDLQATPLSLRSIGKSTSFAEWSGESVRAGTAGESVDTVRALGSILTRVRAAFVDVWGEEKRNIKIS